MPLWILKPILDFGFWINLCYPSMGVDWLSGPGRIDLIHSVACPNESILPFSSSATDFYLFDSILVCIVFSGHMNEWLHKWNIERKQNGIIDEWMHLMYNHWRGGISSVLLCFVLYLSSDCKNIIIGYVFDDDTYSSRLSCIHLFYWPIWHDMGIGMNESHWKCKCMIHSVGRPPRSKTFWCIHWSIIR